MSAPAVESSDKSMQRTAEEIRRWIVGELSRCLRVDSASIDSTKPLYSFGVDSLTAIMMTGALADWLNRDLPASLLWDYSTIDALVAGLADSQAPQASPSPGIVNLQPRGNRSPLFCFPGVKGHPVTFQSLASLLGQDQPCYGLVVPGFAGEQEPFRTVEEIAARLLERIRLLQPHGPYQFLGYSFGGLLALEAAQQLKAAGQSVSLLAMYDTFAPGGRTVRPFWQRITLHGYLIARYPDRLPYLIRRFKEHRTDRMGKIEFQRAVATGTAEPSLVISRKVEDANSQAAIDYVPRLYEGKIILFRAMQRELHNIFYRIDSNNGWCEFAGSGVERVDLPGTHLTVLSDNHTALAARTLSRYLI